MKKILSIIPAVLCAVLTVGSMHALAAPKTMPDGGIFDPEFYAQFNEDVAAVFGTDEDTLYWHYLTAGKEEGRLPFLEGMTLEAWKEQAALLQQASEALSAVLPEEVTDAAAQLIAAAQENGAPADVQQLTAVLPEEVTDAAAQLIAAAQETAADAAQQLTEAAGEGQDPAQVLLDILVKTAAGVKADPAALEAATKEIFEALLPVASAASPEDLQRAASEAYRQLESAARQARETAAAESALPDAASQEAAISEEGGAAQEAVIPEEADAAQSAPAQDASASEAQTPAASLESAAAGLVQAVQELAESAPLASTKELGTYMGQPMTDSILAMKTPLFMVENNGGFLAVDAVSGTYSAYSIASNKNSGPNTVGAIEIYLKDKGWSVYGIRVGMTPEEAAAAAGAYGFAVDKTDAVPGGSMYLKTDDCWIYVGLDSNMRATVVDAYSYSYAEFGKIF